jgi:hypothetical protein
MVDEDTSSDATDEADTDHVETTRQRRVSWEFIFVAFILTLTLMAGMFFMGQALSDEKVGRIGDTLEQFAVERNAQDISQRIATNLPQNNCRALNVATRQTIDDIRQLRKDMGIYEQARKLENRDYKLLKKRYTNLLLEYWLTTQEIEKMCGSDIVKVLYLYADEENCASCSDQGTILTKYRQEYDDRLLVFPLDTTLDMKPVNLIMDSYNITQYPALVIYGQYYEGFKDYDELGTILASHMNQTTGGNRSAQ